VGERLKRWAWAMRREARVLGLAAKDPRVPWHAKALAIAIAAYALSPIDLIPDFIPVIGYLDDLILVPLGVALVIRMIPREVIADLRRRAEASAPSADGLSAAPRSAPLPPP
jgi:uncharacterized membrane protein YkvA (DUF1232 family)